MNPSDLKLGTYANNSSLGTLRLTKTVRHGAVRGSWLVALVALGSVACSNLLPDVDDDSSSNQDSEDGSSSSSGGSDGLGGDAGLGGEASGGTASGGTGGESECAKVLSDESLEISSKTELVVDAPRLARGPSGELVSVGSTTPTSQKKPVGVVRHFSSAGVEDWTREIAGLSNNDDLFGASIDTDGNVYIVGSTSDALGEGDNAGLIDAFLRKYDANGNVVWTRQFGLADFDKLRDVAVHGDAIYVVGYSTESEENGWTNAFLKKFDLDGDLVWTRDIETEWVDTAYRVVVSPTGDVYVAGDTGGELGAAPAGASDAYLRKYTADGDVVWTQQFGGAYFEEPTGLALDLNGNVIVSGTGNDFSGGFWGFVAKYDANGAQSWIQDDLSDLARLSGASTDPEGGIYFGVFWVGDSPESKTAGVRKLTADGDLVWARTENVTITTDVLVNDVDDFYFTGPNYLVHTQPVCATDD